VADGVMCTTKQKRPDNRKALCLYGVVVSKEELVALLCFFVPSTHDFLVVVRKKIIVENIR
jgi:hypothetical protein